MADGSRRFSIFKQLVPIKNTRAMAIRETGEFMYFTTGLAALFASFFWLGAQGILANGYHR
tara:strand:- start:263 stop:445 length:183 start_codon:yes stop_codon:yes gene_type:complete